MNLPTRAHRPLGPHYKWAVLFNTTLGMLMVMINSAILLISLPDIFRGIHLDPLDPANTVYLLWMLMGFLLVSAVLVVSFGRVGDIYGRVRMYNLGFALFTFFSIMLSITWTSGKTAAIWMIGMRVGQGIGGALVFGNASAIVTDAFPATERGLAMGIMGVAGVGGSSIGLILGGLLAPVSWRLVFLVSVPFGLLATIWAYLVLQDTGVRTPSKIDWPGNVTFAAGLTSLLTGIIYGIQPYHGHSMGWTNPFVIATLTLGLALLIIFVPIEMKVPHPMFQLKLFRIRPFAAGTLATGFSAVARGGMQFVLIIWLQGIWLPLHGYSFSKTPLWAAIYLVPMTVGFLIGGPISGLLSDRFGARPFATTGLAITAATFLLLSFLPIRFPYPLFALLVFMYTFGSGMFASPNTSAVMSSLPPGQRGAGSGMLSTFQNSANLLSMGLFFTIITLGLTATLPHHLYNGLVSQGVPASAAHSVASLPPIGSLFAAFLGYNAVQLELSHAGVLSSLPHSTAQYLTGRQFFPHLISSPFSTGLHLALYFSMAVTLLAVIASWSRGAYYVHEAKPLGDELAEGAAGLAEAGSPMAVNVEGATR